MKEVAMKKLVCLGLLVLLIASTVSCAGTPTVTSTPTAVPVEKVVFKDPAFEAKVRIAMEKPTGDITVGEARAVVKLDLSNPSFDAAQASPSLNVEDISDLRYFPGLMSLNLSYNSVNDIAPLELVPSLTELGLTGVQAEDFSPLKSLTKLRYLTIQWIYNKVGSYPGLKSLDVLAGMQDLEAIDIKGCGVVDISALGPLPNLWSALLTDNEITDVSPLADVKKLRELELRNNPITDFSPLAGIFDKLQGKDFELG
jgi:internalin A